MKLMKKIILLGLSTLLSTAALAEQQEQEAIKKNIEILKQKTLKELTDEEIKGGDTVRPPRPCEETVTK